MVRSLSIGTMLFTICNRAVAQHCDTVDRATLQFQWFSSIPNTYRGITEKFKTSFTRTRNAMRYLRRPHGHATMTAFVIRKRVKSHATGIVAVIVLLTLFPSPFGLLLARADDETRSASDSVVKEIAECLNQRGEFLVDPKDLANRCIRPHSAPVTNTNLPFNVGRDEIDKICRDNDYRALSGDIIKRIVAQASSIGPMGIRIIGGVYCDQVDLAGLDLQYSLILDKAVFRAGIAARNLRVKGDFSIDGSLVFKSLTLNRARIDGSFYHGYGFIEREIITDTKIEGTWHQSGTVIFNDARFQGVTISGDLDVSDSALGHFSVESTQIRGDLIFNDSEAICSYEIKTSDVGVVLAERAGLGTGTSNRLDNKAITDVATATGIYSWWLKFWNTPNDSASTEGQLKARELLMSAAVRELIGVAERQCEADERNSEARIRFAILETHVKTNVCLRSVAWLHWPPGEYELTQHPLSALILNGTNIDVGLIVTFKSDKLDGQQLASIRQKRSFEAKGLTAGSLIFDFSEANSYLMQLDGLKFGRIHSNLANCEFKSESPTGKLNASGSSDRPHPPTVQQVATWLSRNQTPTSSAQPFTAFAEAFESIGEDATALRVARATKELWDKTTDWWNTPLFPIGWSVNSLRATFLDSIPIAFQWGLRTVADHGYRPGKAVYGVLITLGVFWWVFWFRLKIVAFEAEQQVETARQGASADQPQWNATKRIDAAPNLLPMGFLFLFDRLIPAFEIRKENYSIGTVYGRVSPFFKCFSRQKNQPANINRQVHEIKYLRMRHVLIPLGEPEKDRFKKWLIVLRVIGIAWGVFLLAALNALIKH